MSDQKHTNSNQQHKKKENDEILIKSEEKQALESKISQLELQTKDYLEKLKRVGAEFENFKKRQETEKNVVLKMANESAMVSLMPVLDAFDLAEKNIPSEFKNDSWVKGVIDTKQKLIDVVKSFGISFVIPNVGDEFNPTIHEALAVEEREGEEKQTILEVYQSGISLHERVLRVARVKVLKPKKVEFESAEVK